MKMSLETWFSLLKCQCALKYAMFRSNESTGARVGDGFWVCCLKNIIYRYLFWWHRKNDLFRSSAFSSETRVVKSRAGYPSVFSNTSTLTIPIPEQYLFDIYSTYFWLYRAMKSETCQYCVFHKSTHIFLQAAEGQCPNTIFLMPQMPKIGAHFIALILDFQKANRIQSVQFQPKLQLNVYLYFWQLVL